MSLLDDLKEGKPRRETAEISAAEHIEESRLIEDVINGATAIIKSAMRPDQTPLGVGIGLRTKVNANIGTSDALMSIDEEMLKLDAAVAAGADAVMDLSTGGDIYGILAKIIGRSAVVVGTVPVYGAAVAAIDKHGSIVNLTNDDLFEAVETHCRMGADFITVHCGINRESVSALSKDRRVTDVVSRGGALLTGWILHNDRENPLFEEYDRLLDIARKYDTVLSLGDGMRPGCIADASDSAQITELKILGGLAKRARDAGVQAIIEGPGHIPLNQVEENVRLEKEYCDGAPFYVLGPLVTDIAPGYDELTAGIGGAIAAAAGADFLCYVTPREHLGLPDIDDVHRGVIASRIAAHAGDIVKKIPGAMEWDLKMAKARKALDWEAQIALSIDPKRAAALRAERGRVDGGECSMCGRLCAMKVVGEYLGSPVNEGCS
jgi:phosphomethylpyrimidine synthase